MAAWFDTAGPCGARASAYRALAPAGSDPLALFLFRHLISTPEGQRMLYNKPLCPASSPGAKPGQACRDALTRRRRRRSCPDSPPPRPLLVLIADDCRDCTSSLSL